MRAQYCYIVDLVKNIIAATSCARQQKLAGALRELENTN
jgi:hypothetical protein